MTIEIVSFPSYKMVIFHSYVSLPEGKPPFSYGFPMVLLWFSKAVLRRGLRQHLRAPGSASRLCKGSGSPYDWDLRRSPGNHPKKSRRFQVFSSWWSIIWLVVWNIFFHIYIITIIRMRIIIITIIIFIYILGIIIPTDELIFFRGVGHPPTRYGSVRSSKHWVVGEKNHPLLAGWLGEFLHVTMIRHYSYPPVIKRGNWKFPIFMEVVSLMIGKSSYIKSGFSMAMFAYRRLTYSMHSVLRPHLNSLEIGGSRK